MGVSLPATPCLTAHSPPSRGFRTSPSPCENAPVPPRSDRCPYCFADLDGEDDPVVRCGVCATAHHEACFLEHGQCTLLGCSGRETTDDPNARAPAPGSLHPFLPLGQQPLERAATFLSVGTPDHDRRRTRGHRPSLTLTLPAHVRTGERLRGTLEAYVATPVSGQGLRLEVRAVLRQGSKRYPLGQQEAVIVGHPRGSWLERFKLWRRPEGTLLVSRGVSRFGLAFDVDPLFWRRALPDAPPALGPVVRLEVRASLDGGLRLESSVARVDVVDGRPAATALAEPPPLRVSPAATFPPPDDLATWHPCPVLVAEAPPVLCAWAGLRCERYEPWQGEYGVDDVRVTVDALERRAQVLRGSVELALRRPLSLGQRLTLEVVTERRGLATQRWRPFAVERVVLATGQAEPRYAGGRYRFAFELPLASALQDAKRDRRLRLHAALRGRGKTVRSTPASVVRPRSRAAP